MRYYRHKSASGQPRLVARDGEDAYDLSAARAGLTSFRELAAVAHVTDDTVDRVTRRLLEDADPVDLDDAGLATPVHASEIWAAGVTYRISEEARESESGLPEIYLNAYEADRPELFFKATPSRTVGPGGPVGIRADSDWNVPEPELGVVLYRGNAVGYTIGNDMSSRSIEGANPLYLPQAKVYDRCCSIGPCVATAETVGDPHDLGISMEIHRDGERVFEGETSTRKMKRTCEELAGYYTRHNAVPELAVVLTGTSLVPPDEFTLREGDEISITIEALGTLSNHVTVV